MVRLNDRTESYLRQIIPYQFESIQFHVWNGLGSLDPEAIQKALAPVIEEGSWQISSLGCFGNPLKNDKERELQLAAWKTMIKTAGLYHTDLVSGFTGRIPGSSVEQSLPEVVSFFTPLLELAKDHGVRIAFENCPMGGNWDSGSWNIAFNPDAWERLFNALPFDNLGLEWEPAHQIIQMIDPVVQLRTWVDKIFHVHGKDAKVFPEKIAQFGISGNTDWYEQRFPGSGETDWRQIFYELRRANYTGTVDIEGYQDPVDRKEREMSGQVSSLDYLKSCRGRIADKPQI